MRTLWLLLVTAAVGAAQTRTPAFTTMYRFQGSPDGSGPAATLVLGGDGALYGTTDFGGTGTCYGGFNGCGTVFRLTRSASARGAWTEFVLYSFQGGNDGNGPGGVLVRGARGALYGTTTIGGNSGCFVGEGCGTVFELKPPQVSGGAWTETVLYRFTGGASGANPGNLVMGAHGVLYGIAGSGGTGVCSGSVNGGCGVVFALTPPTSTNGGWSETVLYSFPGGLGGWYPSSLKAGTDGALYGTTELGGDENCPEGGGFGCGMVFGLVPPRVASRAWTHTVIHRFAGGCCDGAGPTALIIGKEGDLYVATGGGGGTSCTKFAPSGCGSVVRLSQVVSYGAWTSTLLYGFQGLGDGYLPDGLAIGEDGLIYGTAVYGGSTCGYVGCGTVFRLAPPTSSGAAWTETTLYSFSGGANGDSPYGSPIIGLHGVLFGTTSYGGICLPYNLCGTVYQLVP